MNGEVTTFWRQLDRLRETALAGDLDAAGRLLAVLAREARTGEPAVDAARGGMVALLAERFGLAAEALPERPDFAAGPMPGLDPGGAEGVSLVTCCMNRETNLLRALRTWTACSEIAEIVIVDWSSDRPVREAIDAAGMDDPRIRVLRVENEPRWVLSWAFNLGFRAASCARILKADADIVLDRGFFAKNPLEPGCFIAGNWRTAGEDQAHVNGFFFLHKTDIAGVAGFNEFITTYGWDDDDLYDRLDRHGLVRQDVAAGTIRHLPHSDAERLGDAGDDAASAAAELKRDTMHKIRRNRLLAHIMPYWDRHKTLVPFTVLEGGKGDLRLERAGWLPHPVPGQVAADAEHYARLELTSWRLGPRALELDRDRLERLLARPFGELTRLDVELALSNAPQVLAAPNGVLLVRVAGPEGIGSGAAAFDRLAALVAARGQGLAIVGPLAALPESDPAAAREAALVTDWVDGFHAAPVEVAELARAPAGREMRELVWDAAAVAALTALPAPMLAPTRGRVFADGQHGLGNRLRAIASAACIAGKTGRELVVVWQPDAHCDGRFADLFDYDGAVIEETFAGEAEAQGFRLYNYMEVEEGAAKDAPVEAETPGDLYFRSAYVMNSPLSDWEAENRWLRGLTPVEAVRAMVDGVRHPNDVAAHVRMAGGAAYEHLAYEASDGNWSAEGHAAIAHWREKSHFSHFLKRIDALTEEGRADRIFLAADAPETYDAFRACYGDRLAMLERAVYDRSAEQLRYALADALLLGRAPLLLGSTWSSFSELAMRLAPEAPVIEMSGKDFLRPMRVLFSKGIAALSKPRCGSTSLRRMLDPLMDKAGGDIAVNTGGAMPPFHPHITAPYLKQLLRERGHDPDALAWIITVRHPVEMLWSYWKFFKPDVKSRYNFAPKWDETAPMPFERWIAEGKLRANPDWAELAPEWISSDDLSPLSLEFRAMNRDGSLAVDEVFRIEEPERLAAWLAEKTGREVAVKHTNRSREAALPAIGAEALARIRTLLPQESALYGV